MGEDSEQRRVSRDRTERAGRFGQTFPERLQSRSRRREDEGALRRAYDAHAGELFGFALRSLGDRGLAEEVVQETFLRAWRSREKFDEGRGSLRTWLFAIARNLVIDAVRARNSRPAAAASPENPKEAEATEDPSEEALRGMIVSEALESLSEDHRFVINEVYYRDRKYSEVAEEIGVPPVTLRSRMYYALKSLRLVLEEKGRLVER